MKLYCVYLVRCSDNSLYCGITKDLPVRIQRHNQGSASRYTRTRLPVKLVIAISGFSRSEALKIEYQTKQLPKNQKEEFLKRISNAERTQIE